MNDEKRTEGRNCSRPLYLYATFPLFPSEVYSAGWWRAVDATKGVGGVDIAQLNLILMRPFRFPAPSPG